MREHMGLYRGKRIDNGEWIEGSLLKVTLDGKTAHLIFGDNFRLVGNDVKALSHALVDPDTVGECTGITDKNGRLVFEGDIVRGEGVCDETITEMVEYINGEWMPFDYIPSCECEIIGNIHDNPELLKGERNV